MKVLVAVGTRPEAIKLAPVIHELRGRALTVICASGQHAELLHQSLAAFGLQPDIDLAVMTPDQTLNALMARLLARMDEVCAREEPDWVIVQGDTTTALAAGLAAFHRNIRIAHVEAGLRTFDTDRPFPEEANRCLLARIARLHFAPTETARANLVAEHIDPSRIAVTGNTIVDAVAYICGQPDWTSRQLPRSIRPDVPLVLVSAHRRENFGQGLENVCLAVKNLCERYPACAFVFLMHPNPNAGHQVLRMLSGITNLTLLDAVSYRTSLALIAGASLIITDSGGIQEEAPSFGVPVVVIREKTERPEAISAGFATLAGLDPNAIAAAAAGWLDQRQRGSHLKSLPNPFGDGKAARRIADILIAADCG